MKEITTGAFQLHDIPLKQSEANVILLPKRKSHHSLHISNHNPFSNICLNTSEGSYIIPIAHIVRLESSSNYTSLYTIDDKKYIISKTMKVLIDLLPADQFIRCHNSHFVKIDQIVEFKKGSLMLKSKKEIPIARQKYQDVVNAIKANCISI